MQLLCINIRLYWQDSTYNKCHSISKAFLHYKMTMILALAALVLPWWSWSWKAGHRCCWQLLFYSDLGLDRGAPADIHSGQQSLPAAWPVCLGGSVDLVSFKVVTRCYICQGTLRSLTTRLLPWRSSDYGRKPLDVEPIPLLLVAYAIQAPTATCLFGNYTPVWIKFINWTYNRMSWRG